MQKLDRIESKAAPLLQSDIDTDAIFPARFLLVIEREKYREHLFADHRRDGNFVLDRPQYRGAQILVGGPRFGIGSSREHAVWALADFGIRCIIAPSFGDIFRANCFKNGVLAIELDGEALVRVAEAAKSATYIVVDLNAQHIEMGNSEAIPFEINPDRRQFLLEGLDHIDLIRQDEDSITAFEKSQRVSAPWHFLDLDHMHRVARAKREAMT
ncbi:3-isopropylmalate dehydratase small subunit [Altererythrobacter sp. GH1-8]|uniref:3-isopropylmalate dehydratase small subunit n=1 Tax=Altererythrobacter sp. GH1-8 TaxID=3349333 RepID=UPI00374CE1DE